MIKITHNLEDNTLEALMLKAIETKQNIAELVMMHSRQTTR